MIPPPELRMGHDFLIRNEYGAFVDNIYRCCSGNWNVQWEAYSTGPYVWHGHRSTVILHNLTRAIERVISDGARYIEPTNNPNFYWGTTPAGVMMTGQELLDTFFAWLRLFRSFVEQYPNCRWYSDQVYSITPYSRDGIESDGEGEPPASGSDAEDD